MTPDHIRNSDVEKKSTKKDKMNINNVTYIFCLLPSLMLSKSSEHTK